MSTSLHQKLVQGQMRKKKTAMLFFSTVHTDRIKMCINIIVKLFKDNSVSIMQFIVTSPKTCYLCKRLLLKHTTRS